MGEFVFQVGLSIEGVRNIWVKYLGKVLCGVFLCAHSAEAFFVHVDL